LSLSAGRLAAFDANGIPCAAAQESGRRPDEAHRAFLLAQADEDQEEEEKAGMPRMRGASAKTCGLERPTHGRVSAILRKGMQNDNHHLRPFNVRYVVWNPINARGQNMRSTHHTAKCSYCYIHRMHGIDDVGPMPDWSYKDLASPDFRQAPAELAAHTCRLSFACREMV
jgi:hypothetical protein